MNTTFSSGFYISMNEKKHTPAKAHSSHATLFQKYNHNKFSNKFYWWAPLKNSAEIFHSLLKCSVNGKLKTAEHTLKIAMRTNYNSVYYSKTVFGRFIAVFHGIRFWCAQQNSYAFTCNCSLFFGILCIYLCPFASIHLSLLKLFFLFARYVLNHAYYQRWTTKKLLSPETNMWNIHEYAKEKFAFNFICGSVFSLFFYCWSHGFSLWPIKM